MNEAISAAIAANLPAAVASELSTYLKQAESDKTTLANVRRDLELAKGELTQARTVIIAQDKIKARELALAESQASLRNEQLQLATDRAKLVAEVANASRAATLDTVALFLKLPSVRTNVLSEVGVAVAGKQADQYGPGWGGTVMPSKESHTTTQTQE